METIARVAVFSIDTASGRSLEETSLDERRKRIALHIDLKRRRSGREREGRGGGGGEGRDRKTANKDRTDRIC